ncbi:hypothetical protein, partial [Sphaerochaeta sp. S2]|uniref:hypothetical protein n=1 Tax=Sphaerochaeta sp. S2 TaxID=2798868 RepID=UPI0018EA2D40
DLLSNHIYQHIGDWEEIYEAICDEVDDIREAETGEKNYRRARKNGRGRIIGGGFGVEGAIKGIATAGAVNAASGLMHSFGNAIGNASSSANARKQEREILQNPEFLPTIKKTVYNDILGMHVGVIELYNKSFNTDIPLDYPTENYQEALIILQNVNQGVVHESNMNKAMVDAIVKWPYDYQFYNFIISKDSSSTEELERYAHYFNTDITNIRLSKEKALAQKKKIETQFGQYANEFMTNLSDNYYFNSLVDILSPNPIENLTEAYKLNKFSFKDNKLYVLLFDEGEKAKKCVQVASSTYAQLSPNEVPIIAFDNTSFSGGKEGFLITDQKIHVKVSFEKPFSFAFKDIQTIATDNKSNLLINNNKVDFLLMRGKDKSIIGEFITFVLYS